MRSAFVRLFLVRLQKYDSKESIRKIQKGYNSTSCNKRWQNQRSFPRYNVCGGGRNDRLSRFAVFG